MTRMYWKPEGRPLLYVDDYPLEAVPLSVGAPCPACHLGTVGAVDYAAGTFGHDGTTHDLPALISWTDDDSIVVYDRLKCEERRLEGRPHHDATRTTG